MKLLIWLTPLLFILSCNKADEVDPCVEMADKLEGTYEITTTLYPRQPSQEGETKDILVFTELDKCSGYGSTNEILFNNLFVHFGCTRFELLNNTRFTFEYADGFTWALAPLKGEGSIIDGEFHFEGMINTSAGEFPIILDGFKSSSDRRTNAC